jgi:hypothetical protein
MSAARLCREEGVNDIFSARLSAKRGNTAPSGDGKMSCEARNLSDICGFAQLSKHAAGPSRVAKWTVIGSAKRGVKSGQTRTRIDGSFATTDFAVVIPKSV